MSIEMPEIGIVNQRAEKTQGLVSLDAIGVRHVAFEKTTRHEGSLKAAAGRLCLESRCDADSSFVTLRLRLRQIAPLR